MVSQLSFSQHAAGVSNGVTGFVSNQHSLFLPTRFTAMLKYPAALLQMLRGLQLHRSGMKPHRKEARSPILIITLRSPELLQVSLLPLMSSCDESPCGWSSDWASSDVQELENKNHASAPEIRWPMARKMHMFRHIQPREGLKQGVCPWTCRHITWNGLCKASLAHPSS